MCALLTKHLLLSSVFQGNYDSGFLYHCQFPPFVTGINFQEQEDEPFDSRLLEDTEHNPIHTFSFRGREL